MDTLTYTEHDFDYFHAKTNVRPFCVGQKNTGTTKNKKNTQDVDKSPLIRTTPEHSKRGSGKMYIKKTTNMMRNNVH